MHNNLNNRSNSRTTKIAKELESFCEAYKRKFETNCDNFASDYKLLQRIKEIYSNKRMTWLDRQHIVEEFLDTTKTNLPDAIHEYILSMNETILKNKYVRYKARSRGKIKEVFNNFNQKLENRVYEIVNLTDEVRTAKINENYQNENNQNKNTNYFTILTKKQDSLEKITRGSNINSTASIITYSNANNASEQIGCNYTSPNTNPNNDLSNTKFSNTSINNTGINNSTYVKADDEIKRAKKKSGWFRRTAIAAMTFFTIVGSGIFGDYHSSYIRASQANTEPSAQKIQSSEESKSKSKEQKSGINYTSALSELLRKNGIEPTIENRALFYGYATDYSKEFDFSNADRCDRVAYKVLSKMKPQRIRDVIATNEAQKKPNVNTFYIDSSDSIASIQKGESSKGDTSVKPHLDGQKSQQPTSAPISIETVKPVKPIEPAKKMQVAEEKSRGSKKSLEQTVEIAFIKGFDEAVKWIKGDNTFYGHDALANGVIDPKGLAKIFGNPTWNKNTVQRDSIYTPVILSVGEESIQTTQPNANINNLLTCEDTKKECRVDDAYTKKIAEALYKSIYKENNKKSKYGREDSRLVFVDKPSGKNAYSKLEINGQVVVAMPLPRGYTLSYFAFGNEGAYVYDEGGSRISRFSEHRIQDLSVDEIVKLISGYTKDLPLGLVINIGGLEVLYLGVPENKNGKQIPKAALVLSQPSEIISGDSPGVSPSVSPAAGGGQTGAPGGQGTGNCGPGGGGQAGAPGGTGTGAR
ncbi:MAG: hypothetical protein QXK37_03655 [Candidatus Woesearchaeota archaeon]